MFITKVSWLTFIAAVYFGYKNFSLKFTIFGIIFSVILVHLGFKFLGKILKSKFTEKQLVFTSFGGSRGVQDGFKLGQVGVWSRLGAVLRRAWRIFVRRWASSSDLEAVLGRLGAKLGPKGGKSPSRMSRHIAGTPPGKKVFDDLQKIMIEV